MAFLDGRSVTLWRLDSVPRTRSWRFGRCLVGTTHAGSAVEVTGRTNMLYWGVVFFTIAAAAVPFGFGGTADTASVWIARALSFSFLLLAVSSFALARNASAD